MQGVLKTFTSHGSIVKNGVLRHIRLVNPLLQPVAFSRFESATPASARIEEHGFESTRIADVLNAKGKGADGSWLWCTTDDSVYDAVKSMTQHNVGALVVVKSGEQKSPAGIITERVLPFPGVNLITEELNVVKSYMNSTRVPQATILQSEVIKDVAAPLVSITSRASR